MRIMKNILLILLLIAVPAASPANQQKAATVRIKGKVLDAGKNPVAGASVMIDGLATGASTDIRGKYSVTVNAGVSTIGVTTSPGMTAEENIGGRKKVDLILPEKIMTGNRIGEDDRGEYETRQSKSMTRAGEREESRRRRMASYNTIYDMIRGEVPGVQVMGESITIEGISSLHMSSEPLFVVNGIPVNSIDFISPTMVRSIEVLKGSETSFYGLRGANGVIVITLNDAVE